MPIPAFTSPAELDAMSADPFQPDTNTFIQPQSVSLGSISLQKVVEMMPKRLHEYSTKNPVRSDSYTSNPWYTPEMKSEFERLFDTGLNIANNAHPDLICKMGTIIFSTANNPNNIVGHFDDVVGRQLPELNIERFVLSSAWPNNTQILKAGRQLNCGTFSELANHMGQMRKVHLDDIAEDEWGTNNNELVAFHGQNSAHREPPIEINGVRAQLRMTLVRRILPAPENLS